MQTFIKERGIFVFNMLYIIIIISIFLSECCVKKHMDRVRTLKERRPLAGGRIILKKYYNTGAAGNLLSSRPGIMLCIHGAVLGTVSAALCHMLHRQETGILKLGLAFMAGGGLSNLYDRLTKGHVVDYLSFGFGPKRFCRLVFNAADFFVFTGAVLCAAQVIAKKTLSPQGDL